MPRKINWLSGITFRHPVGVFQGKHPSDFLSILTPGRFIKCHPLESFHKVNGTVFRWNSVKQQWVRRSKNQNVLCRNGSWAIFVFHPGLDVRHVRCPRPLRNRLPNRLEVLLKSADPALSLHGLPGIGAGLGRVLTAHPHLLRLNLLQFILQTNVLLNEWVMKLWS